MNYLLLGRIAKLVALLGFFLPWVVVSCSDTVILEATGFQLMTGDIQPSGALEGAEVNKDPEPSPFVIAAFAVIALALVGSVLTKARTAAIVILVGAIGGIGLSYYAVSNMQSEMTRSISESQAQQGAAGADNPLFNAEQQREMSDQVARAIRIEKQEGYWLTLGALIAAAICALLFIASARAPAASVPEPPA